MATYPIKGKYYGWKIDDVPASELLRLVNTGGRKIKYWLCNYIIRRKADLELEMKGFDCDLEERLNDWYNNAVPLKLYKAPRKQRTSWGNKSKIQVK